MHWILLLLAGIAEVTWAVAMKYAEGFTKPVPSVITGVFYILSAVFLNPTLSVIAEHKGRSVAQIILRFLLQEDILIIPKSSKKERMEENLDVFGFKLSEDEMETIRTMDRKKSYFGWPSSILEW